MKSWPVAPLSLLLLLFPVAAGSDDGVSLFRERKLLRVGEVSVDGVGPQVAVDRAAGFAVVGGEGVAVAVDLVTSTLAGKGDTRLKGAVHAVAQDPHEPSMFYIAAAETGTEQPEYRVAAVEVTDGGRTVSFRHRSEQLSAVPARILLLEEEVVVLSASAVQFFSKASLASTRSPVHHTNPCAGTDAAVSAGFLYVTCTGSEGYVYSLASWDWVGALPSAGSVAAVDGELLLAGEDGASISLCNTTVPASVTCHRRYDASQVPLSLGGFDGAVLAALGEQGFAAYNGLPEGGSSPMVRSHPFPCQDVEGSPQHARIAAVSSFGSVVVFSLEADATSSSSSIDASLIVVICLMGCTVITGIITYIWFVKRFLPRQKFEEVP